MLHYLLDYPLGKNLKNHLEFYVIHLEYEQESGRQSALEMLACIFDTFPQVQIISSHLFLFSPPANKFSFLQKLLNVHAGLFFVPMVSRLVNESSTACCQAVALAIKNLVSKVGSIFFVAASLGVCMIFSL